VRTNRIAAAIAAAGAATALAIGLAACATPGTTAPEVTATASAVTQADQVTVTDAWVKTVESGMSAAFGVLVNDGDTDVNVVAVTSPVSMMIQLHETVENADGQMVMQEKEGGFVIPAMSEYLLEPGGNHIMLMDVAEPIVAGDVVEFTLEFADGSTKTFDATAKDYTGANETYVGGGMDMGGEG